MNNEPKTVDELEEALDAIFDMILDEQTVEEIEQDFDIENYDRAMTVI